MAPVNDKRVYGIKQTHNPLLAQKYSKHPEPVHDAKVIVMRSNLRWCSDGFEFTCRNGDIVRLGVVHQDGELGELETELVGDAAPLLTGGFGIALGEGGGHEG